MTTNELIAAHLAFIDQTKKTQLALIQIGELYSIQVDGMGVFTTPDKAIAQDLILAFQAAVVGAINKAVDQSKTIIKSLVDPL